MGEGEGEGEGRDERGMRGRGRRVGAQLTGVDSWGHNRRHHHPKPDPKSLTLSLALSRPLVLARTSHLTRALRLFSLSLLALSRSLRLRSSPPVCPGRRQGDAPLPSPQRTLAGACALASHDHPAPSRLTLAAHPHPTPLPQSDIVPEFLRPIFAFGKLRLIQVGVEGGWRGTATTTSVQPTSVQRRADGREEAPPTACPTAHTTTPVSPLQRRVNPKSPLRAHAHARTRLLTFVLHTHLLPAERRPR